MPGLVVDRELALDVVQQRRSERRRKLGPDQRRPPGIHDPDRVCLVIVAVRARTLAVDPVRAARYPRIELVDRGGERGVAGMTDDLQCVGQHLDAAQVLGAGDSHRVDQVGQRQLALVDGEIMVDVVVEQLRAVDGRELLPGRAVAVAGRLLVVPTGEERLVDNLGVPALGRLLLGQALGRRLRARVQTAPRIRRPGREQRVGVRRADWVQPRVEVGDVLVVGVEPVERVADLVSGVDEVLRAAHLGRAR